MKQKEEGSNWISDLLLVHSCLVLYVCQYACPCHLLLLHSDHVWSPNAQRRKSRKSSVFSLDLLWDPNELVWSLFWQRQCTQPSPKINIPPAPASWQAALGHTAALLAHTQLSLFAIFIVVVRFIWLSCLVYFHTPLMVFTVSANTLSSVCCCNYAFLRKLLLIWSRRSIHDLDRLLRHSHLFSGLFGSVFCNLNGSGVLSEGLCIQLSEMQT